VGSGQWAVGSGQWAVGSGQWAVGPYRFGQALIARNWQLATGKGAPQNSGMRLERACDRGRMANHRAGPGPAAAGRGQSAMGRPRSGVVRRDEVPGPDSTPQCPSAAMRPQSQVGFHNFKMHPTDN